MRWRLNQVRGIRLLDSVLFVNTRKLVLLIISRDIIIRVLKQLKLIVKRKRWLSIIELLESEAKKL